MLCRYPKLDCQKTELKQDRSHLCIILETPIVIKQAREHRITNTYHYLHRSGPPVDSSVPLDKEVCVGSVDDFIDPVLPTGRARRAANVRQLEDDLDNLSDRRVRERRSNAIVEPGTVEVVRVQRPGGVDSGRIREVGGLRIDIFTPISKRLELSDLHSNEPA